MHARTKLICLACAAALALLAPAAAPSTAGASGAAGATSAINSVRAQYGLPALKPTTSLRSTSSGWASYMIRHDVFQHDYRPHVGRRFHVFGENIAIFFGGHGGPRTVVQAWLHSAPHRRIMLSRTFRYIGVGTATGTFQGHRARTWVARFGR